MTRGFIVTGTNTGIGKTVFSAALTGALRGAYWKPVQSGLDEETDSETVLRLAGLPPPHILPEAYRLAMPASPHIAAAHEGLTIEATRLLPPTSLYPLVIEGAGGLLVPLTDNMLQIDLFRSWRLPVILCASTALGTINHTLLSLEALRQRTMPVLGVAFLGEPNPEVEASIVSLGGAERLGRLPLLDPLNAETLAAAFNQHFSLERFQTLPARDR